MVRKVGEIGGVAKKWYEKWGSVEVEEGMKK